MGMGRFKKNRVASLATRVGLAWVWVELWHQGVRNTVGGGCHGRSVAE